MPSERERVEKELAQLKAKEANLTASVEALDSDAPAETVDYFERSLVGARGRIAETQKQIDALITAEEHQRIEEEAEQRDSFARRYDEAASNGTLGTLPPALRRKYASAKEREAVRRLLGR